MKYNVSRRGFLQGSLALGSTLFLPKLSLAKSANGKLQHACIGVGGMGFSDLQSILAGGTTDIIALCDVDAGNLAKAAEWLKTEHKIESVRQYRDWRELLEKEGDKIDSVNVSTPDHMHAPISYSAIQKGKHVYCQKPLTHTVNEARILTRAARKAGVVTQMGIQCHADIAYRMAVAILQSGGIGKVTQFHSWQSGSAVWTTAKARPEGEDPVPANLDWNKWIGVAPMRPFKADIYHQAKWRGWQDFGSGVMGDFACHIFDPVFTALKLGAPLSVKTEISDYNTETYPVWQIVQYEFPGTEFSAGKTVKGTWYNGEKIPPRELVPMPAEYKLPGAGSIIVGEEGVMVLPHWAGPQLYPLEKFKGYQRPKIKSLDHYQQWVDACLGKGKPEANFDFSGPMTETVLLGNVGIHFAGKTLQWDPVNLKIPNMPEAEKYLKKTYREGWSIPGIG
ncbi:MAG: Gfo/Idh/MocA family oxidoreductase [Phycisphaerae bacterium]|nr:Gfo/Idh/MocA family oxidoreductase [Phycisphaerae bacterium]